MHVENNEIVYHYCTVDTFLSVIQNSTLWLSDINKLNDYKECILIRDKIRSKIEEYLAKKDTAALKAWKTWYQINADLEENITSIYTVCFSEAVDSLNQWIAYAENGRGVAIGFSKEHLQALNNVHPCNLMFNKIVYIKRQQEKFVDSIVEDILKKMESKGVGHAATELNSNYLLSFSLYKNLSFNQEMEWRIMLLSAQGWKKLNGNIKEMQFMDTKFRCTDGKLISYLEMNFSKIKQDFIKEIWIGPKSEISKVDIRNVLLTYNYYGEEVSFNCDKPIRIQHSTVSYR